MSEAVAFEGGQLGRRMVVRLRPNQDLVEGVELACAENEIAYAIVRSAVGSLVDASLIYGAPERPGHFEITGPGIEILTLSGEVRLQGEGDLRADLRGTVADPQARVFGGQFERGGNLICITLELVLQEWLPD